MNKVSILVSVNNDWNVTTRCLSSIVSSPIKVAYELILVDNGSDEAMPDYYRSMVPGIRILRSDTNRGRSGGYNFAVRFAEGDFVVLLANDIIVTPGWLDELVFTKLANPGALIVGPKCLMLDGRILEAGSVIFNDGTVRALGLGDHAQSAFFNFVRDTYSISTACALVDRHFFLSTGGFDPQYDVACYEDADLCTRVRSLGGRVVYTPFASVLRQQTSSLAENEAQSIPNNQQAFSRKWHDNIERGDFAVPSSSQLIASTSLARQSILVIDKLLPWYDRASGAKRTLAVLGLLKSLNCHVTFAAVDGRNQDNYIRRLQAMGIEVVANDGPAAGMPELGSIPWEYLFENRQYKYVWLTFWDIAAYYLQRFNKFRHTASFVVDSVDLEFVRLASEAVITGNGSFDRERSLREIGTYQYSDMVITVSELERDMLRKAGVTAPIEVIPNIHEVVRTSPPTSEVPRRNLLFVGNFNHLPNRDAIIAFVQTIFPLIHQRLQVNLLIAGNNPTEEISALEKIPGVTVLGWVPDLAPTYDSALAAIAPLRYGAGIKGKITEALSLGIPVVATPEALTGMEAIIENEAVLVAEASDPEQWISAVTKLLRPDFWALKSIKGREACAELYGPERARKILERIIR